MWTFQKWKGNTPTLVNWPREAVINWQWNTPTWSADLVNLHPEGEHTYHFNCSILLNINFCQAHIISILLVWILSKFNLLCLLRLFFDFIVGVNYWRYMVRRMYLRVVYRAIWHFQPSWFHLSILKKVDQSKTTHRTYLASRFHFANQLLLLLTYIQATYQ